MTDLGESKAVPEHFKTCDEESRSLATRIGTKCMLDDGFFDSTRAAAYILPKLLQYAATIREQAQTIASLQQQDRIKTQEINLAVKGYRELEADNLELARRHNEHVSLLSQQAQTIERLTKALEQIYNGAWGVPNESARKAFDIARKALADRRAASQNGESQ